MPVTSFPAEFLELYRQAARKSITIKLDSPQSAHRFRARLHSLRVLMRKEGHRYLTIAEGVQISVSKNVLIARPSDHAFVKALKDAGVELQATPQATPQANESLALAATIPELLNLSDADLPNLSEAALAELFGDEVEE